MSSTILENHRGMTNVHPLASFPFRSRPQQDLKPIYFPGGETKKIGDVTVTTDVDVDPNRIQHIKSRKAFFDKKTTPDENGNVKFDPRIDTFAYNIELYFSKDAIKLEKAFKEIETDPKGMIFFIEDNTDDISAQFCKIKIGSSVKDNLKESQQLYNSKSVYNYINSFVTIDKELFQELIIHGKIESVPLKAVEFLFTAANLFIPEKSKFIIGGLGKICQLIGNFIKKGKLEDYRWNPQSKKLKEDGTEDADHKFEPFLFPFVEDYLDQVDDSKVNEFARQSFTELKKGFLEHDASIRSYIEKTDFGKLGNTTFLIPLINGGITTVTTEVDVIPDSAEAYIFNQYKLVSNTIISKLNELENFDFTDLIKQGVRVANAFLCGIWNGLLEALSGLFLMFEMIFKAAIGMQDFAKNFSTQFPILMEYVDNTVDAIKNINFTELYKTFKSKIKETKQSLETIAYFSGAFIGFVIELAIEIVAGILITGGVLSVAAVLQKLSSIFTGLFKGIAKVGKKVFNFGKGLVVNTFKGFKKLLDQLIAFLRQGTKGLKDMINKLFDDVKKVADDLFTQGKNLAKGGGDITKSFAENAGIKITKIISNGKVFGQATDHTCVASSLKMILHDKGIIRTEEYLATALKTDSKGASILDIPEALYNSRLDDVIANAEKNIKLSRLIEKIEDGSKAVVSLVTDKFGKHAVLLEKIENGKVFLRDPLPLNQGSSYSISLDEFNKIFGRRAVIIK